MLTTFLIAGFLYCLLCAVIAVAAIIIRVVAFILRVPACVLRARLDIRQRAGARERHGQEYFTGEEVS